MTKKFISLMLISFLPLLRLSAQISDIEKIYRSSNDGYVHYTSIVRNYKGNINVLMQYGYFTNVLFVDSVKGRSSFLIQNASTGDVTHIVSLPKGYKVNDVRFVTLRKRNNAGSIDFCCFCGTRTEFDHSVALPNPGSGPSTYIDIYSQHGFAGFFSMEEALNPMTLYTAKVRDVEKTKELFRMTCYPENEGFYYSNSSAFVDNAVLDIVGLDDTVNAPSCFCRVKFYPDNPGVRWDNNIRLNQTEILTDVTKTDNYVATVSYNTNGDNLWVRYSGQEDHLVVGGLELNDYVSSLDFSSLVVQIDCKNNDNVEDLSRRDDARMCHTINNETEICFRMAGLGYGGLLACRYNYSYLGVSFIKGAYLNCIPTIKDLVHMPLNDASAILYKDNWGYISILKWDLNNFCNYPVREYYHEDIGAESITLQNRNTFEHLLWSGKRSDNVYSPMFLLSQRGEQGGGLSTSCLDNNDEMARPVTVDNRDMLKYLRIQYRFSYDTVAYPVSYINFNPHDVYKTTACTVDE